jgi:hypothetical protein
MLQFMPSIIAMQVIRLARDWLYSTMESDDRESTIPPPLWSLSAAP